MTESRPAGIRISPEHPTVVWVRREVVPRLREELAPEALIVFDPPDRPVDAARHAPGLLVVASRFRGTPVADRVVLVRELLAAVSPVRPLCLTPEEFEVSARVPGPVIAAARSGARVL
jgi:hypothetical protein